MDNTIFLSSKAWLPNYLTQNLEKMLNGNTPQERVGAIRDVYSLLVRTITITVVSQYLFQQKGSFHDEQLHRMLANNLPELNMDAWLQLLFASMKAFRNQPGGLFIQEIYSLFWDTTSGPRHVYNMDEENQMIHLEHLLSVLNNFNLETGEQTDWEKLEKESSELLAKIIEKYCFLQEYELIRVSGAVNDCWEIEVYKGKEVVRSKIYSPEVDLTEGWFYWHHAGRGEFLRLNPFLVFWQDVVTGQDVAMYDGYISERLQYLLTLLGMIVIDKPGAKEFDKLMNDIITEAQGKPKVIETLDWAQLAQVCARISKNGMIHKIHRYKPELYQQRLRTFEMFERYLESRKKVFVLVGKSGSGKSSFLLSLGSLISQKINSCAIMFEGRQFDADSSIENVIAEKFNLFVSIYGRETNNVWEEIDKVNGIAKKQVILFIDAINENNDPQGLLRQLDTLAQNARPWLKIVYTCRPETWRGIRCGMRLDEKLYYQELNGKEIGSDQQPFSFSDKLEAFSNYELESVYEKYKTTYKLKSDLQNLQDNIREILKDPFNLWLVSFSKEEQEIPKGLTATNLVKDYIQSLKKNLMLDENDLDFLEQSLIPLLFSPEKPIMSELPQASCKEMGGDLIEKVLSQKNSIKGEKENKSFTALTDADILVMRNENSDWRIGFTHERFYEYFVGERIFKLGNSQKDRHQYFKELILKTNQSPFLWGAVKYALALEMEQTTYELPLSLCYTKEQRVKEMMVDVLVGFGYDHPAEAESLLGQLLPQNERPGVLKKAQRLLRKVNPILDLNSRNALKIAIETASKLHIAWVLVAGALQKDPTIRTSAVRYGYYLWRDDPKKGFEILKKISEAAFPGIIPNLTAFESLFAFSLIIFIDHFNEVDVLKELQFIWSGNFIAKIFIQDQSAGFIKRRLITFARERIFFNAIGLVMALIKGFPQYAKAVNYSYIDAFFKLGPNEKALYKKLVIYLDLNGNYDQEQMKADYLEAINVQCLLFQAVVVLGLSVHANNDPDGFLPFLKLFLSRAEISTPQNIWVASIPTVLMSVLDKNPEQNKYFDLFVETAGKCQVFYKINTPEAYYTGPYVLYQYLKTRDVRTPWLLERIEKALTKEKVNVAFFRAFINSELVIIGIERKQPSAALQVLAIFFANEFVTEEVREEILVYLTRLRIYFPDEVDNFLKEQNASDNFCLKVHENEPTETVGALIGGTKVWKFALDALTESTGFQKHLIHILATAADFSNTRKWLVYVIRYLLNLVYGHSV